MKEPKKNIWCRLGIHVWYYGCFSWPVWARYERHCIEAGDCNKKQYKDYKTRKWVTFK